MRPEAKEGEVVGAGDHLKNSTSGNKLGLGCSSVVECLPSLRAYWLQSPVLHSLSQSITIIVRVQLVFVLFLYRKYAGYSKKDIKRSRHEVLP